jgi:hypothetical protein
MLKDRTSSSSYEVNVQKINTKMGEENIQAVSSQKSRTHQHS